MFCSTLAALVSVIPVLCSLSLRSLRGWVIYGTCRGIVTADVLVQGLSRGAIATRKLKGVKRDKGHEDYTSSAPYGEGKSLL